MNRRAGAEPFFCEPLPDAPWPVEARNLLTDRELSLYQSLLSLYPDNKIFVQVALSQLIEVDRNHPDRESIRARYKQLVADFVLCRSDLSVVAVIELDDRSHDNPRNQYADARKSKALKDARIRLVRVPAGALPSEDMIRKLIDVGVGARKARHQTVLRLAETVDTYSVDTPTARRSDARAKSRALKSIGLQLALGAVLLGGWLIYSQLVPFVFQRVMQPLTVRHVIASTAQPSLAAAVVPAKTSPFPVVGEPPAQTLAEEKRAGLQAAALLQKQKDQAWAAYYSAPTSCEHPVDWNAQVECGNQFMRAEKRFEAQWVADHASGQSHGAAVVLANGSMGGAR